MSLFYSCETYFSIKGLLKGLMLQFEKEGVKYPGSEVDKLKTPDRFGRGYPRSIFP